MTTVLVDLLQTTGTKGGIESYIRELYSTEEFQSSGYQFVGYASKEAYRISKSWFPGKLINSEISGENRIEWAWGELFGLQIAAKKINASLVHCPAMLGPIKSKVPTVLTIHDLSYFSHPELMRHKFYTSPVKWMEKRAAINATRIISISGSTTRAISEYLGTPSSKIDQIYSAGRNLGGDFVEFGERETNLFISMGQRSPYKKLETVIEAWALIPVRQRPKLIITGSHGKDPLVPLVEKYSLHESVKLLGWVSDSEIYQLLSRATAFIETTVAAGFGMPALEAMQLGLPVISSDIEVFRETTGGNAIFFQPGDPEDLAKTIQRVVNDFDNLKILGTKGYEWQKMFNWSICAKETLKSFAKAMTH